MSFPSAVSTASAVWKKCIRVSFFFLHFLILKTFAKTLWLAFPSFSLISSFARLSLRTNLFEPQKGKYAGSGSEFNPLALLRGLFLEPGKTRNFVFSLLGLWRVLLYGCNPLSFLFKGISRREDRGGRWGSHLLRGPTRLGLIAISNLRTKLQETIVEKRNLLFIQTFWKYEWYNDRIYYMSRNSLLDRNRTTPNLLQRKYSKYAESINSKEGRKVNIWIFAGVLKLAQVCSISIHNFSS